MIQYFSNKVSPEYAVHFALAAYNTGPSRVNRSILLIKEKSDLPTWDHLKKHIPAVTCHYVESILLDEALQPKAVIK